MTTVDIEIHEGIISVLNKIKDINDSGIELEIPEGSVLFDNILNLKLIQNQAEKMQKTVHFHTRDTNGLNLIGMMEEGNEISFGENSQTTQMNEETAQIKEKKVKLPIIKFPKVPQVKISQIFMILLITAAIVGVFLLLKSPKAYVKIVVKSEPLIKSVTIRVLSKAETDTDKKILKGTVLSTTATDLLSEPTTGTLIIGKKAKGTVTIYNKTDSDKEFKKGLNLTFEKDSKKFNFTLIENVTISARTQLPEDINNPGVISYQSGTSDVDVGAVEVGDKYNISKDSDLTVSGQKNSDFSAKASNDFSGGYSKTVKAVAKEDLTKLSGDLYTKLSDEVTKELESKGGSVYKSIIGSTVAKIDQENFNFKEGEAADTLQINQTVSASGLFYAQSDLNKMLNKMVEGFVPEGFVLSDKEKEIKVEILGNSDTTILSSTQADIQVTLKSYIITDIEAKNVKEELKGKGINEAQKILGGIKNIKTYELNIAPNIPFLKKVPNETSKITVDIQRE